MLAVFCSNGQSKFPETLPIKSITYKSVNDSNITYDLSTSSKKIFIFFDYHNLRDAELLYEGCCFMFDTTQVDVFPICFTGYLFKKPDKIFETNIPIQNFNGPFNFELNQFQITESDLPLVIIYNENNEMCGFANLVENLTEINCKGNL